MKRSEVQRPRNIHRKKMATVWRDPLPGQENPINDFINGRCTLYIKARGRQLFQTCRSHFNVLYFKLQCHFLQPSCKTVAEMASLTTLKGLSVYTFSPNGRRAEQCRRAMVFNKKISIFTWFLASNHGSNANGGAFTF